MKATHRAVLVLALGTLLTGVPGCMEDIALFPRPTLPEGEPDVVVVGEASSGEEAVRLAQTSGRTQREIASDLGIGLSTLVRWIGRSRDRQAVDPLATQSDITAELKRLRRENEILRQERDILKKATAFFAREGSR